MHTVKHHLKQTLACSLVIVSTVFSIDGKTDLKSEQEFLKARVKNIEQHSEHAEHQQVIDKSTDFHGVFYGYLPCQDCNGVKITLSLKQKNLYLLVTQSAKESSREFYEKGKYLYYPVGFGLLLEVYRLIMIFLQLCRKFFPGSIAFPLQVGFYIPIFFRIELLYIIFALYYKANCHRLYPARA